ncbi:hypothetical protein A4X06_0g3773 [Tilletia controversa]|uniref:Chromatin assembly factor 1 subunit A dimerization domain-containing protein n=1 Tax=Tilletia controversa TaxID=13291 RepID=A0A8X7MV14_9BASI|nr:hypothetical protein CF328_g534 [Tilletia controversa]KAE8248356.1 hypothetical protein A4X06_0g3773 [Tilletia controversa]
MRQAQLSFAPVASISDSHDAQQHGSAHDVHALPPPMTLSKHVSSQQYSSSPREEDSSDNEDALSPPKSTPSLVRGSSASPPSSQGPPSSPLLAHAPSRTFSMLQGKAHSKSATIEDCGFEILIPLSQASKNIIVPGPSSQASSSQASQESVAKPTVHQPLVTKKKNKVMTDAEKAEQEAKMLEAKTKREEKEQELKAKQEAKRLKAEAREAKEAEQKAKQEAKEEQLRQKTEAREAKDHEQQQKKEAREAKEEELRLKREARDAEKQKKEEKARKEAANHAKTRNFMTSFLVKPGASSSSASKQAAMAAMTNARANAGKSDFQRTFIPGVYKDLAPINRWQKPASSELLRVLEASEDIPEAGTIRDIASPSKQDLLADLKRTMPKRKVQQQTADKISAVFSSLPMDNQNAARRRSRRGIHPPVVVRQVMRGVAESDILGGEAAAEAKRALDRIISDRSLVRLKFIHFDQDRRPGWYGTFTRPSNLIGPRRPFAQDPVLLDYSYDSDDEWEDQGQLEGEDLDEGQDAEEEEKEDSDDDSEMDDWLIDDLEEVDDAESTSGEPVAAVVSCGGGGGDNDQRDDDDDDSSDILEVDAEGREIPKSQRAAANRLPIKRKAAAETDTVMIQRNGKQKRVKALGRRFNTKLIPFAAGPHWEESAGQVGYALFQPFQVEFLNNASYGLNPFTFECTSLADMVLSAEVAAMPSHSTASTSSSAPSKPTGPTVCKATGKQTGGPGTLAELFALANAQDDPLAAPGLPPFPVDGGTGEKRGRPKGVFPDELLPAFLLLVDGSTRVKPVLVEELKERFADAGTGGGGGGGGGQGLAVSTASVNVSKVAIEKKLNEVAAKDGKGKGSKWVVKGEFRARYGLPALTTPAR